MPAFPDFSDLRYVQEVGYFIYYQDEVLGKEGFEHERVRYSRALLDEALSYLPCDEPWLQSKTIASLGCGCSGDLLAWPAALKFGIDPLLYTYQHLGMLGRDVVDPKTIYLSVNAEDVPLLDECIDLIVCRNALDHIPRPDRALYEAHRLLKGDGFLFLLVDIGGQPTPDEPNVFSTQTLRELVEESFEVLVQTEGHRPYSKGRDFSVRLLAQKKPRVRPVPDRLEILRSYMQSWSNWRETQQAGAPNT